MKKSLLLLSSLCFMAFSFLPVQLFAEEDNPTFSQAELDQMLAPIALYPDSLLSQILMASTYPGNVAEAVKWSKNNPKQQGDEAVTAVQNQSWDPSVMSLVAFPQVLEMMGKQTDWVQNLGDAFLAKPETVMDTVQTLRAKAKQEGNLETTEQQTIIIEPASPDIIVIEPADPQVVYVPTYNPTTIYGTWWYPSYPPYYHHPVGSAIVAGISFGIGVGIVNSLWGGCRWGRGRGGIDINVNRYNNINIGNKIGGGGNRSNWKHNSKNRNAPYRDRSSRDKFSNNRRSASNQRNDFRGRDSSKTGRGDLNSRNSRDADRRKAQNSLKNRGIDPAAGRKNLSGSGGNKVRSQVNNIDRNRGGNKGTSGGLSKSSGLSQNRSRNTSANRSKNTSTNRSRSSSLSGVGSNRSSSNYNRGSRSRSSSRSSSLGGGRGGGRR